jgi:hypothetical protein
VTFVWNLLKIIFRINGWSGDKKAYWVIEKANWQVKKVKRGGGGWRIEWEK